ncbi:hypothetical protein TRFO_36751 [Tritrichomonas foetus]|uniref:Uncharacterized protein n=1 Tax=Tritrichomonas foetus TaxID=1144522 RepID=A0A1J4JHH6_9EUKA|nr:hypothetical protein TRFO_36751 [Tritrichomonas foetus]|eukprot:OHS97059.1 hypothetical protein TRFO_36751 [Tritrichomonas foetus]
MISNSRLIQNFLIFTFIYVFFCIFLFLHPLKKIHHALLLKDYPKYCHLLTMFRKDNQTKNIRPLLFETSFQKCIQLQQLQFSLPSTEDEKIKIKKTIGIIVAAHNNGEVIEKMINFLQNDDILFFIHFSKNCNYSRKIELPNTYMLQRHDVNYPGFTIVTSLLYCYEEVLNSPYHFDYIAYISGYCYPLINSQTLLNICQQTKLQNLNFLQIVPMTPGFYNRLKRYSNIDHQVEDWIFYFIKKNYPIKKMPFKELHVGQNWCMLTYETILYIMDFVNKNPDIANFFYFTRSSSEHFFHCILGNSKMSTLTKKQFVFCYWKGSEHAAKLTRSDIKVAYKNGALFARKIVHGYNDELIHVIENQAKNCQYNVGFTNNITDYRPYICS